jgi:uncharacterized protein YcsI (UPF0317 family)
MSLETPARLQTHSDSTPKFTSATDLRAAARRGKWHGTTAGHCPNNQQANLVRRVLYAQPDAVPAHRDHATG